MPSAGRIEEGFEFGKDYFGLDQCQARLYTAILRYIVLVTAALAICAVTAARLKDRTDSQAPPPARPDEPPPGASQRPRSDVTSCRLMRRSSFASGMR